MKSTSKIWLYFALTILSAPIAMLLTAIMVQDQDPAGQGVYGGMFFFILMFLSSLLFGGKSIRVYRRNRQSMGKLYATISVLSITPCVLILITFLALLIFEYAYSFLIS